MKGDFETTYLRVPRKIPLLKAREPLQDAEI